MKIGKLVAISYFLGMSIALLAVLVFYTNQPDFPSGGRSLISGGLLPAESAAFLRRTSIPVIQVISTNSTIQAKQ